MPAAFSDVMTAWDGFDFPSFLASRTEEDVRRVLARTDTSPRDYLTLLSPAAAPLLEDMAVRARDLTLKHFGKTVVLYTPLYLANFCCNHCRYCGFNTRNDIPRKKLTLEELDGEARAIADTGLRHILLLTGESPADTPPEYIIDSIGVVKKHFTSVSIEVFPMSEADYGRMTAAGVDGLTVYQETYDRKVYADVHPAGPKRDYGFRLATAERACRQDMRAVNIGALLGLADWRIESFFTGLHAGFLQDTWPAAEVSVSVPRMQPHTGMMEPAVRVTDRELVQIITAFRIYRSRCGITLSTREPQTLRDNLIGLGITRMSAGSSTAVGGHTGVDTAETRQFEIADNRDVERIRAMLHDKGYQAVFKDWMPI